MRGLLIVPAPAEVGTAESGEFDPGCGWQLHPQVAVRPEPFGALLYHFGTRKLSFLKNRTILTVVQSLADHSDVWSACRAAGVNDSEQAPYLHALGTLAGSHMLVVRGGSKESEWLRQPRECPDSSNSSSAGWTHPSV